MDLYKQFHDEAKEIKPLADRVRTLEKQLAAVRERIRDTVEDVDRKAEGLAAHRDRAGESLTKSTSAFSEWQGRLRRLEREHGTACEALALLERDIGPQIVRDLADAMRKRDGALHALYNATKPACEERMAALLADVVGERDAFTDAWGQIYRDFGANLTHTKSGSTRAPVALHPRVARYGHHNDGRRWVEFAPPVSVSATPAPAPEAVPDAAVPPADGQADPEAAPGAAEAAQDAPEAPQHVLTGSGRNRQAHAVTDSKAEGALA